MARVTVTHPDGEVVSVAKADADQSNFDVEAMPEGRELQYASIANVMGTVLSNLGLQDVEPLTDADVPATVRLGHLRRPGSRPIIRARRRARVDSCRIPPLRDSF